MKVHEVLTEAPLGTGVFGRMAAKFTTSKVAQDAIKQWSQEAKRIEQAGVDLTPENYEQEINRWLGKWLGIGRNYPGNLTDLSAAGVNKYIAQAVAQRQTGKIAGPETTGTGPSTEKTTASLAPGIKVINPEPPIIQFRGKDYVLDDIGDWIALESGKLIPQSFKNFLDQQLEIAQGLEPGATKRK